MQKEYYECFSNNLYNYLSNLGFESCKTYIHKRTKVRCYVFKMNDKLSEALHQWSKK